jgi:hypothetical protein
VERQKALSLPGGFESAHLSFSHPSGLMRNLGAIVRILLGIVGDTRQDRSTGSSIALQLVGDDPEWLLALTAQQSAKEPLGCTLIAARLQQNIDDITILIHGTPKILLLAVDSDEEFVQIPGITEASLFLLKTSGIVGSEFPAPTADGFVRNNDSAFGQKIFHITEAQTEAMIDPYGVADDFRRETVSVVTGWGALHEMSLSVGCPS